LTVGGLSIQKLLAHPRVRLGVFLFAALIGAVVFVSLASPRIFNFEALEVQFSLQIFDRGMTEVFIPPVGRVGAQTHLTPFKFVVTLRNIDLKMLEELIAEGPPKETGDLVPRIREGFESILLKFSIWLVLLSAIGAALGVALLGRRTREDLGFAGAAGAVVMALVLTVSVLTYNIQAFRNPEYRGLLSGAPWMLNLVEESVLKVEELGQRMQAVARNLTDVFAAIDDLETLGAVQGEVLVLVVSDIHNNPAALDFVEEVVASFKPDFAIDCGDLTDWGTPLETPLLDRIADLSLPYVFAAGNHDSPAVMAKMRTLDNVIVLEGQPLEMNGIWITGLPDPSSASNSPKVAEWDEIQRHGDQIQAALEGLKALQRSAAPGPTPSVKEPAASGPLFLVIHMPALNDRFIGQADVILNGHTHNLQVTHEDNTSVINPGTTGAAGLRSLESAGDLPFSLILLHIQRNEATEALELVAADTIRVFNVRSRFTLTRILLTPEANVRSLDEPGIP